MTEDQFDACLQDRAALDALQKRASADAEAHGVTRHADLLRRRAEAGRRTDAWKRWTPPSPTPGAEGGRRACISAASPFGLQVLRRSDRVSDRARPDRHRRPERLRQVEPAGSPALGDGRQLRQGHARRRHGRRDLRRLGRPARPQPRRGDADHRQRRPRRAGPARQRSGAGGGAAHRPGRRLDLPDQRRARCGRATCSCCSPTPRPAPTRRPWCARARSQS